MNKVAGRPIDPTVPDWSTSNPWSAVEIMLHNVISLSENRPFVFWRPCAETAPAMESSKHRLSVRKSSTLIEVSDSTARSVTD